MGCSLPLFIDTKRDPNSEGYPHRKHEALNPLLLAPVSGLPDARPGAEVDAKTSISSI